MLAEYCDIGLSELPPACNNYAPFSEYYDDVVGNKGATFLLDPTTKKIFSGSMNTHAHVNKAGYFISAVADATKFVKSTV